MSRLSTSISILLWWASAASAGNFSFTGTFVQDDQLEIFLFSSPTPDTMVRTWGYAGGINANGQIIPAGGLDPYLSLFDANGGLVSSSALLARNDAGDPCPENAPGQQGAAA